MRSIFALAVPVSALLAFSAATAQADDAPMQLMPGVPMASLAPPRVDAPAVDLVEPARGRWYGWQTLAGIGLSDVILVTGAVVFTADFGHGTNQGAGFAFMTAGISGHLLAGPVAHWSHHHIGRGFASLALMTVGAAAGSGIGAGIGAAVADKQGDQGASWTSGVGIAAGLGAGLLTLVANAIDVAALSYDTPEPKSAIGSLHLAPLVAPHAGGITIGGLL